MITFRLCPSNRLWKWLRWIRIYSSFREDNNETFPERDTTFYLSIFVDVYSTILGIVLVILCMNLENKSFERRKGLKKYSLISQESKQEPIIAPDIFDFSPALNQTGGVWKSGWKRSANHGAAMSRFNQKRSHENFCWAKDEGNSPLKVLSTHSLNFPRIF